MGFRQDSIEKVVKKIYMNPSFWNKKGTDYGSHSLQGKVFFSLPSECWSECRGVPLPPPINPSFFELAGVAFGMVSLTGDVSLATCSWPLSGYFLLAEKLGEWSGIGGGVEFRTE